LKRNGAARWVIAACLFVAGSCAPVSQGLPVDKHSPYDTAKAEKTLSFAFTTIIERHLERVNAATIALEGMRGLGSIDAEIAITRLGDRLLLNAADRVVAEYPAPGDDDVQGWARLTITMALEARGVSQPMRAANVEKIYEAVLDATLAKLDVFSRYYGAKEAADHQASRNGFGGIGVTIDLAEGGAKLLTVLPDSPASQAGLNPGDILTRVDGEPLTGLDKEGISARLRGRVASDVAVVVAGRALTLRRALIVPPTVTATLHDGIAEFKISGFNHRTASSLAMELKAAQDKLGPNLKGAVLDLRGNPGGLLDQAVMMADLFMTEGPIVSTRGRHPLASQSYEAREGDIGEKVPLVVLVDGRSASAAEIVAGALEDSGRAVVIGTNSYGKGTVQTVIALPNDGEMTLTWSRFFTPSGYALHGLGVLPTLCTADLGINPDRMVDGLMHASAPAPVVATLARWRTAGIGDADLRRQLRGICPSAKHGDSKVEMEIAERLLNDQPAYQQALALSSPAVAPTTAVGHGASAAPQQVQH
jgi:carboxyl-terminal processing protease